MSRPERVQLRGARIEDAEAILAALDPSHTKNLQFFHDPISLERERAFLRSKIESPTDHLSVVQTVVGDRIVGTVGLHELDKHNRNARIGRLIFREEDRAQGYGAEAEAQLLFRAFLYFELHKVYARLLWDNTDGQAHYLKLGFKVEGRMREEYFLDGKFHDMTLMSILKSEWEARRSPSP